MQTEGKFLKQWSNGCAFGRVLVEVDANPFVSTVEIALNDDAWHKELRSAKYDHPWFAGARYGVLFASHAANVCAHVRVLMIAGTYCDSTPTSIAAAAADAVWKSLGFTPPPEVVEQMTQAAQSEHQSWAHLVKFDE